MSDHLYPAPVEKRVYERLHRDRETGIEASRRARAYQARLDEINTSQQAMFLAGVVMGMASAITIVILLIALWASGL